MTVSQGEIAVVVGGVKWQGWTSISLTRGMEVVPSNFSVTGTEKYPGSDGQKKLIVMPSSPCQIMLGDDLVLSGYVDGVDMEASSTSHSLSLVGRSKLEDLVDCSSSLDQNTAYNCTLGSIAKQATTKFGISVSLPDGDTAALPVFSCSLTESGYDAVARFAQMYTKLLYDDVDGNLVIANVGTQKHASGFEEGVNIEAYQSTFNCSERYTSIAAVWQDTDILTDGTGLLVEPLVKDSTVTDDASNWQKRADGNARYRPLVILAEVNGGDPNVLIPQRTKWEMARRIGRSQGITVTCDSWRDSAGKLWTPNQLAPIKVPSAKLDEVWLISSVTYIRDTNGTHAQVTLMPSSAFTPAPIAQNFFDPVVAASTDSQTGASTPTQ